MKNPDEKNIQITDVLGRVIQSVITEEPSITLDLTQVSAGIYLVQTDDGMQTSTLKFIRK